MSFGLVPLKPEGSISMIADNEPNAVNNAKDKLIQYCAKEGFVPEFMEHDMGDRTQVIATRNGIAKCNVLAK